MISHAKLSTPLARTLLPNLEWYVVMNDRNVVGRGALVQIFAIRTWQLRHGGQFPDQLDQLVPQLLPYLPNDPYSGRPFGYVRASGQLVAPLSWDHVGELSTAYQSARRGWLLYSVGPDGKDSGGTTFREDPWVQPMGIVYALSTWRQPMDIVFAIPPTEDANGVRKDRGRGIPGR